MCDWECLSMRLEVSEPLANTEFSSLEITGERRIALLLTLTLHEYTGKLVSVKATSFDISWVV